LLINFELERTNKWYKDPTLAPLASIHYLLLLLLLLLHSSRISILLSKTDIFLFLKKMDSFSDNNNQSGSNEMAQQQQGNAGGQQEDYVDKGLDMAEKKEGVNLDRSTNEKITDTAREGFESITGKDVPDKFSN